MSSPATSSGFRLEACGQLRIADRRAQVGEQAELLAQAQDGLLGAQRALELVVLPVADGAEQHRVGGLAPAPASLRAADGRAPRRRRRRPARSPISKLQVERVEHLDRLGDDLGADAVAGQDCDLHGVRGCVAGQRSRWPARAGVARRSASNARILSAWRSVRPMSSKPLSRQCLRNGSTSKAKLAAVGLDDHLPLEVDRQLVAGEGRDLVEQPVDLRLGQHDRQQAVLEAVVEEDVGEARRDHARGSRTARSAHGACSRERAAAEVLAREQDRRALVARLVQHEVRVRAARCAWSCPGSPWSR